MNNNESKRSVGIYVHIPFCQRKCSYCDFYSITGFDEPILEQYCKAITEEIKITSDQQEELMAATIFLGGGTPSLLSARQIKSILQQIKDSIPVKADAEITLEANPATLDADKIKDYLEAGINRISLGAQSFADHELSILGRLHNTADILHTIELFHKNGLKNFNLDLIYGIPGQSISKWEKNLLTATECGPAHISAYLLQPGEDTALARNIEQNLIQMCHENMEAAMYETTIDFLSAHGFKQYEISNFSLPKYQCRHNLTYWQGNNYLGFGAGAVSYMKNRRYINNPEVLNYIRRLTAGQKQNVKELENMSLKQQLADKIVLGLRLCEGINIEKTNNYFNVNIENEFEEIISLNIKKGLLELRNGYLFLTRRGYFLSNEVICHFIA